MAASTRRTTPVRAVMRAAGTMLAAGALTSGMASPAHAEWPDLVAQFLWDASAAGSVGSLGSLAALGPLGSLGSVAADPPLSDLRGPVDYVALGDSFAALGGNSAERYGPDRCGRNVSNYPSRVAAGLPAGGDAAGEFTDATCSGAVTGDLSASQYGGVPPQYDALSSDTDLVTVSIGGNDMGFGAIVGCIVQNLYSGRSGPCSTALAAETSARIDELRTTSLPAVYGEIQERSPGATVVATTYVSLVPEPGMGTCRFAEGIGADDLDWLQSVMTDLNGAIDTAAEKAGIRTAMPTDDIDRSGCAPADDRWVAFQGQETDSADMHPTALGQQVMADAVLAALE